MENEQTVFLTLQSRQQKTIYVLLIIPAQYQTDSPPKSIGRNKPTGERVQFEQSNKNYLTLESTNVNWTHYPYDTPITFDNKYIYCHAAAYIKGLIESIVIDSWNFKVTVVDEGFNSSRFTSKDYPNFHYSGFLGTIEDICIDRKKIEFFTQFDIVAFTGQIHQIGRAYELSKFIRSLNIPVLWGGIGVTSIYLGTHQKATRYEEIQEKDDPPLYAAWKKILEVTDCVVIGEGFYKLVTLNGERDYVVAEALKDLMPLAKIRNLQERKRKVQKQKESTSVYDEYFREGFLSHNLDYLPLAKSNQKMPLPNYDQMPGSFTHQVIGVQYLLGCRFNCPFCLVTRVQGPRGFTGLRKKKIEDFVGEIKSIIAGKKVSTNSVFLLDDDFFGIPVDDILQIAINLKNLDLKYLVQADIKTLLSLRSNVRVLEQQKLGEVWAIVKAEKEIQKWIPLSYSDGIAIDQNILFKVSTRTGRIIGTILNPIGFDKIWGNAKMTFIEFLIRNGLFVMYLGLETVDQDELDGLKKGAYRKVEMGFEALEYLASLNSYPVINLMIGQNAKGKGIQYAEMLIKMNVTLVNVFVLTAYPGTPAYRDAFRRGDLYFPLDTMGMHAFKFFDTMRGNISYPNFNIYEQRKEALSLNKTFYSDESIKTRLLPYAPRLWSTRKLLGFRLHDWLGILYHNVFYQSLVEKGFSMPYAGGLNKHEIPLVAEKAVSISIDLLMRKNLPIFNYLDDKILKGFIKKRLKKFLNELGIRRLDTLYTNLRKH